jgi:hypothetical protein
MYTAITGLKQDSSALLKKSVKSAPHFLSSKCDYLNKINEKKQKKPSMIIY